MKAWKETKLITCLACELRFSLCLFFYYYFSMSGMLPFSVETKDDDDEDEKLGEVIKRGKWSFDSKAFQRSTSEVKDLITSLLSKDAK